MPAFRDDRCYAEKKKSCWILKRNYSYKNEHKLATVSGGKCRTVFETDVVVTMMYKKKKNLR